jgi:general secretion pathway protein D
VVVLGGLLQDEYSGNQEKVPVLGDIPLVGNLFKNEQRSRRKTNLMVFLRPVVVRDGAATEGLAMDRYDLMRGLQQGAQPRSSVIVPVNEAPVLPLMPAPLMPGAPGGAPPQQPSLAPAQPMPAPSPSSQSIGAVYDPSLYRP